MAPNVNDDEALARALQEEYEKEYRRRGMQQHLRPTQSPTMPVVLPSAPPPPSTISSGSSFDQPFYQQPEGVEAPSAADVQMSDEEYARQLDQEQRQTSAAPTTFSTFPSQPNHLSDQAAPRNFQSGPGPATDAELALRMEQELRDEELARQWVADEQLRRSNAAVNHHRQRNKCGICCAMRRILSCFITMVLIVVAAVLVLYFVTGSGDVKDFITDPDRFRAEDPFNNANPADANLWRTKGAGLELTIINALDEEWHSQFDIAVKEWDAGSPDALTLFTETTDPESTCKPVNRKLKVCNGNYGATNWRGINKVLLENGWIYSSAARMNDYYVSIKDAAQRQYTMCHEIGHGFGLPHTDEDFFNRDLRNCMDYTNNPKNNMQPDEPNFKFLTQLYGATAGTSVSSAETVPGKNLRRLADDTLPSHIQEAYEAADHTTGRVLHQSDFGHSRELDLGDGFTLQVHVLAAAL